MFTETLNKFCKFDIFKNLIYEKDFNLVFPIPLKDIFVFIYNLQRHIKIAKLALQMNEPTGIIGSLVLLELSASY